MTTRFAEHFKTILGSDSNKTEQENNEQRTNEQLSQPTPSSPAQGPVHTATVPRNAAGKNITVANTNTTVSAATAAEAQPGSVTLMPEANNRNSKPNEHPIFESSHSSGMKTEDISYISGTERPPVFAVNTVRGTGSLGHGSLRKKPTISNKTMELEGINPVIVLIDRLEAWKAIIKVLLKYFEEMVELELQTWKSYQKVASVIEIPIKETDHFKDRDSIQNMLESFQKGSKNVAADHNEFANFLLANVLKNLAGLKKDIKDHLAIMRTDEKMSTALLSKEANETKRLTAILGQLCAVADLTPEALAAEHDPWVVNVAVSKQIERQVTEENRLHNYLLTAQRTFRTFEEQIIHNLKVTLKGFYEWRAGHLRNYKENPQALIATLDKIDASSEWEHFMQKHREHLISDKAGFKDINTTTYPNMDHSFTKAIKTGRMERKSGVIKNWNPGYYVITPAGNLHEFKSSEELDNPELTLFLPNVVVRGPDNTVKSSKNGYILELKGRSNSGFLHREKEFLYRVPSIDELNSWMESIKEVQATWRLRRGEAETQLSSKVQPTNATVEPSVGTTNPVYPPANYLEHRPHDGSQPNSVPSSPQMTPITAQGPPPELKYPLPRTAYGTGPDTYQPQLFNPSTTTTGPQPDNVHESEQRNTQ